jgi:hypothetical protein
MSFMCFLFPSLLRSPGKPASNSRHQTSGHFAHSRTSLAHSSRRNFRNPLTRRRWYEFFIAFLTSRINKLVLSDTTSPTAQASLHPASATFDGRSTHFCSVSLLNVAISLIIFRSGTGGCGINSITQQVTTAGAHSSMWTTDSGLCRRVSTSTCSPAGRSLVLCAWHLTFPETFILFVYVLYSFLL